jgi:hypothetical protein
MKILSPYSLAVSKKATRDWSYQKTAMKDRYLVGIFELMEMSRSGSAKV